MSKIHVGIIGFGALGQYLAEQILVNDLVSADFELAFVYNRSIDKIHKSKFNIPDDKILQGDFNSAFQEFISIRAVDLVVEASHPDVIKQSGAVLLNHGDLMITSLTSLADDDTLDKLKDVADQFGHAIYLPAGAGWGFQDIKKMADLHQLTGLSISMKFNFSALKLNEPLLSVLSKYIASDENDDQILFEGSVRELAALAPNNVNTMCGLALAGHTIGFDKTKATLIASKAGHQHEVDIQVLGPDGYMVESRRINPAKRGAVTGSMTFSSFLASLLACKDHHDSGVVFV